MSSSSAISMSAPMQAPSWILGLLSSCTRLSRVVAATLLSGYVTQLIFPSCRQVTPRPTPLERVSAPRSLAKLLLADTRQIQLTGDVPAQYLALVAGRTIPCVWNVFTAGLLQTHIFTVRIQLASCCMRVSLHGPRCTRSRLHGHDTAHATVATAYKQHQCRCLDLASDVWCCLQLAMSILAILVLSKVLLSPAHQYMPAFI